MMFAFWSVLFLMLILAVVEIGRQVKGERIAGTVGHLVWPLQFRWDDDLTLL